MGLDYNPVENRDEICLNFISAKNVKSLSLFIFELCHIPTDKNLVL